MAPDIFYPEDVAKLLSRKVVVFLGDSNVRAVYKDFVTLTQKKTLISRKDLKAKMEKSYFGDRLTYHGQLCNGRDYVEEREFNNYMNGSYRFYFLTRIYNKYAEKVFKMIQKKEPQVVVMNSCLWDVTRWGPNGVEEYKKNLRTAMQKLRQMLPSDCLIMWMTCAPITVNLNGGFLVKQLEFLKYSLRFHVMEANHYAHKIAAENGVDILDVHHSLRMYVHLRAEDGIHWQPPAVRHVTNLILTHLSLAFDVSLPHRFPPQVKENVPEATVTANASNSKRANPNTLTRQPKGNKRRHNNRHNSYYKWNAGANHQNNCVQQPFTFGQQTQPQFLFAQGTGATPFAFRQQPAYPTPFAFGQQNAGPFTECGGLYCSFDDQPACVDWF